MAKRHYTPISHSEALCGARTGSTFESTRIATHDVSKVTCKKCLAIIKKWPVERYNKNKPSGIWL